MVLDMGSDDKVLSEHAKDMALPEFCESADVRTLAIYSIGPQIEDFNHIINIHEGGFFRADKSVLVMNESLITIGKGAGGAFDFILHDPRFQILGEGLIILIMPRLACMAPMRDEGLTFYEAAEGKRGKSGRAMSLGHQFMVKTWINKMAKELESVEAWLP